MNLRVLFACLGLNTVWGASGEGTGPPTHLLDKSNEKRYHVNHA